MHHYAHRAARLHNDLRATLEEADHYYTLMIEAGEHPNLDRMGYTSHITLDVFRRLLNRPNLQVDELAATLREALIDFDTLQVHTAEQKTRPIRIPRPVQTDIGHDNWTEMTARFLSKRANENETV